jgi:hypothetical protein
MNKAPDFVLGWAWQSFFFGCVEKMFWRRTTSPQKAKTGGREIKGEPRDDDDDDVRLPLQLCRVLFVCASF